MRVSFEALIVTENEEKRIRENYYQLEKQGYRLYPLEEELYVAKRSDSKPFGKVIIKAAQWKAGVTLIEYELVSLDTVN